MRNQRTLASIVKTSGVGLHTGERVELVLCPAVPDHGIRFIRSDLPGRPSVPARMDQVTDTRLSTLIEQGAARVSTVEHLMSALAGLGVDNAIIEISGPEVPILDGSSAPFVFLIQSVGLVEQSVPRRYIRILESVEVVQGDKTARFDPYYGFRLTYEGRFEHPAIQATGSTVTLDFSRTSYVREVSRARTFGFTHEVEYLRNQGLARGGSMDNAIVMDEYRVLNSDGLRYADEFLRHKILDAVGDLYLLGHPLIGAFTGIRSGHALNNVAARALWERRSAWEWVTLAPHESPPSAFIEPLPQPQTHF
ncbi:MAG: UDP-3-O-acyl-N-acetylglucosamine deacetylase [Betaproteobacteria bacterium]|jgi:UDP-3-O-[3-hydroxymyristoyl] N-acetylglucosamine deacetylase (EC 3.5.1.-)|nr:UDP-3-O-acyl-N-acetylglucosamine deacetylase [Betaproteobacteria bacterium]